MTDEARMVLPGDGMNKVRKLWSRLPASVRWGAAAFVFMRVVFWAWGVIVLSLLPPSPEELQFGLVTPVPPMPSGPLGTILGPWVRWDVQWYTSIAVHGYGLADGRGAFGPLFPALIHVVASLLGGQVVIAAFLVADLFCLGSLILLFELAQREGFSGRRAVASLLIYPFAFFLFVPYTESLLLFFSLASVLKARAGQWRVASLFGALAVLTKVTALLLLVLLAWEVWEGRRKRPLRNGAWLALIPLAFVGWTIVRQAVWPLPAPATANQFGLLTPLVSQEFQVGWGYATLAWPWDGLVQAILAPFRRWPHPHSVTATIDLMVLALVVYYAILTLRMPRRSYHLYVAATIVVSLILIVPFLPLEDAPRRWMMAFPLFMASAGYLPRRLERGLIVPLILMQVVLTIFYIKWVVAG